MLTLYSVIITVYQLYQRLFGITNQIWKFNEQTEFSEIAVSDIRFKYIELKSGNLSYPDQHPRAKVVARLVDQADNHEHCRRNTIRGTRVRRVEGIVVLSETKR